MTDKKVSTSKAETRKVRVHEQRTYVEEEPIAEDFTEAEFEEIPTNPIEEFLRSIDTDRVLNMHVFALPTFSKDGRFTARHTERSFVTTFPFTNEEVENYRQRVQYCVPQGGHFAFELRERGLIVKAWVEQISPAPGYKPAQANNGFGFPPPPVINVNSPEQSKPTDSLTMMREQMGLAKDLVAMAKDLTPPPPVVNVGTASDEPAPASLKDKILEGVIMTAFKGDSVPADRFDRVLEVLGGGRPEPSWLDSLMSGIAPHLGNILGQVGPGLNAMLMRLATGAPVEASAPTPMMATTSGVIPPEQTEQAQVDPAEYAWRRVLGRILDDVFEHTAAVTQGRLGIDVHSSAEAVVDLGARFSENPQITGVIEQLLGASPEQVIALCATMVPPQVQERVLALAQNGAAVVWIGELQQETKAILSEPQDGGDTDEKQAGD